MSSITARGESGSLATSTGSKEKEPFRVQSELFASTRLAPKVHALYRARSLLTDVIAHECVLLALMSARLMYYARDSSTSDGTDADSDLPRIGILGGGHIGSAVALTLLKYQYPTDKIAISTRQPDRVPKCEALQSLQAQALFHTIPKYYDNARLSKESDLLVLCMPPSQLKSVAIQIKHALCVPEQPTVVISVLCGATVESLQKSCGSRLVTRAKVNVAMLTAPPLTITPNGNDRCEDGDGNGDVGNGADLEVEEARETAAARSSRRRSTVHIKQRRSSLELAARELGKNNREQTLCGSKSATLPTSTCSCLCSIHC